MPKSRGPQYIVCGMVLMGGTGILIGLVLHSYVVMGLAGAFGIVIGWFIGWLGGWKYLMIVCLGVLLGTALGYPTGDRDIIIMSAGSGAAIAGFLGAQLELFLEK